LPLWLHLRIEKKECIVRRAYHWPDLVIGVTPHKDDEKKILILSRAIICRNWKNPLKEQKEPNQQTEDPAMEWKSRRKKHRLH
jgi:hypothetical protein